MGRTFSTITGQPNVQFLRREVPAVVHSDGNNATWTCDAPACGTAVLFVYRTGSHGSSAGSPATCVGCGATYYLDPPPPVPEPPRRQRFHPAPVMTIV